MFYAQEAIKDLLGDTLEGKKCVISGSGNVAQYTAEKLLQLGATVLTFSDSSGYIYEPNVSRWWGWGGGGVASFCRAKIRRNELCSWEAFWLISTAAVLIALVSKSPN